MQFTATKDKLYLIHYHKCNIWGVSITTAQLKNITSFGNVLLHNEVYLYEKERYQLNNVYVFKSNYSGVVTLYFADESLQNGLYTKGNVYQC